MDCGKQLIGSSLNGVDCKQKGKRGPSGVHGSPGTKSQLDSLLAESQYSSDYGDSVQYY